MAWIKVPKENHPIFLEALPRAHDIETMPMFGGICVMVNGNIAGGLFARSVMVRLDGKDQAHALKAGASPFDPMGRGQTRTDKLMLPESVMMDGSLRTWLEKAIDSARTIPPKAKREKKAKKEKGGEEKKPAASAKQGAKSAKAATKRPKAKKAATKKR